MKYNLNNNMDAVNAQTRLDFLKKKGAIIELTEKRTLRTISQNALFHLWIKVFADYLGEPDIEAVKRDVKRHLLGQKITKNTISKEEELTDWSTSELDETAFSQLLSKFKEWAAVDFGVYLPYVGDEGYEEMIQTYN